MAIKWKNPLVCSVLFYHDFLSFQLIKLPVVLQNEIFKWLSKIDFFCFFQTQGNHWNFCFPEKQTWKLLIHNFLNTCSKPCFHIFLHFPNFFESLKIHIFAACCFYKLYKLTSQNQGSNSTFAERKKMLNIFYLFWVKSEILWNFSKSGGVSCPSKCHRG